MQLYSGALERLEGGVGWSSTGRVFRALLLEPGTSTFDAADAVVDDVLGHARNNERTEGGYGRSPVIFDTIVVGIDIRQLRFAVPDGVSQNAFRDKRTGDVVIYEVVTDDTDSVPVVFLSAAETLSLVDGGKAIYELPELSGAAWPSVAPDSVQPYLDFATVRAEFSRTDAQIKALGDGVPVEVIAAPGDGMLLKILSIVGVLAQPDSYLVDDVPDQQVKLRFKIGGATIATAEFGSEVSDLIDPEVTGAYGAAADFINQPLTVRAFNSFIGTVTGGGDDNSLRFIVIYSVLDLA